MKTPLKRKMTKSAFIREILVAYLNGELQWKPVELGFQRVSYKVMTDEHGQKWDVPETDDLQKHDPERWKHTFEIIHTNPFDESNPNLPPAKKARRD